MGARAFRWLAAYAVAMIRDKFAQVSLIAVMCIILVGERLRLAMDAGALAADMGSGGVPVSTRSGSGGRSGNSSSGAGDSGDPHAFRGVVLRPGTIARGNNDDVQRLTFMLYRLVVQHGLHSVVDVPCARSLPWVGALVARLEFEVPGFRYYCVLKTDGEYAQARMLARNTSALHVVYGRPPPGADLAFLWHAFGYLSPGDAWALVRRLRVRYVAVPNHPYVERNSGLASRSGRVNVRRAPYRFGEPKRVISDMHVNGAEPKQLLFYERRAIRL